MRRTELSPALTVLLTQVLLWSAGKEPPVRDLHTVELFSGDMEITKKLLDLGCRRVGFDKRYDPDEDLCASKGFETAMSIVLRLRPHGHLWAAPVCSSWGFIGRSATGRSQGNAGGNRYNLKTKLANRMVVLLAHLILLAYVRNVHIWLEQPLSSIMPGFSPMTETIEERLEHACTTYLYAFGSASTKPLKIWSTCPNVQKLSRKRPKGKTGSLAVKKGKKSMEFAMHSSGHRRTPRRLGRRLLRRCYRFCVKRRLTCGLARSAAAEQCSS